MGNPAKPMELRQGHPRAAEEPESAIVPRDPGTPLPIAPVDLAERGTIEWEKIWSAGWWLKPDQDYHLVEMVAHAYDDLATFQKDIKRTGLTVKGYTPGQIVANPLIKEKREAERIIIKCLSLLGFSPSDRARLAIKEIQRQSGIKALQQQQRDNSR